MNASNEVDFNKFYIEVKAIEKRDSVLTSEQQIARLLRPGSLYFNLNPFEVLQIEPDASLDEAKTKFKRLSLLVHPDKNLDEKERAQQAFEVVRKAWSVLENEETRNKCMAIIEEAKERTEHEINEKRKKNKGEPIDEDNPEFLKKCIYVTTMKMFAEAENRRRHLEKRNMEEKKRQREQEIEEETKSAMQKEWQKNFDDSRQERVDSWKQFQKASTSSKKVKRLKTSFKPPRHKAESR